MEVKLRSIEQAPSRVPDWRLIMEDLCQPPLRRVAKVLGLSLRTVQRYDATGEAPRHVLMALFWLTSWGQSAVHTKAHNDAVLLASYVSSLRDQVQTLDARIAHLVSIGDFGSANQPAELPERPRNLPMVR